MSTDLDMPSCPPLPIAEPSEPSAAAPNRTAALEFYLCPELRQQLLGLCGKHTLTKFIRVERKCVFDVARVLYKEMSYIWVRSHMAVTTPRQKTYCEAVEVIDCRGAKFKIAPAMLKKTDFVCTNPNKRTAQTAEYLAVYNTSLFNLVVPPMRKKCPRLRSMIFGSGPRARHEKRTDAWTVHFDPVEVLDGQGKRSKGPTAESGGRIEFRRPVHLEACGEPPSTIPLPSSPSAKYPVHFRFDLFLMSWSWNATHHRSWVTALREGECFGALYKVIECEQLPVTLDDLAVLYGRQAGYTERLETITARYAVPWSLRDLECFASIASTSLRSLILLDNSPEPALKPIATYEDLPSIIEIVRNHLPNLSTLHIVLQGIQTADAVCRDALDERILKEAGTISELHIFTPPGKDAPRGHKKRIPLFNVIRLVSRLCTKRADIALMSQGYHYDRNREQTEVLRCLWQAPPDARAILAGVDFRILGIRRLQEIPHLGFHSDGRPMGLWEKEVKRLDLSSRIREAQRSTRPPVLTLLTRALQRCSDTAVRIEEICPAATTVEMFGKVNTLQKHLRSAKGSLQSGKYLSGSVKLEKDLSEFATLLKKMAPALSRGVGFFEADHKEEDGAQYDNSDTGVESDGYW